MMDLTSAKQIGAGLAAIGLGGAAAGIGVVFSALVGGIARNPSMMQQMLTYTILGFALAEATGLFCLMVSFMILFG